MRFLLAFAAAVLVLLVGVFVVWNASSVAPREVAAVGPPVGGAPRAADAGEPKLEQPPVESPAAGAGAPGAPSTHAPVEIPTVDLDTKYAGWSIERLEGAKAMVDATVQRIFTKIVAERRKAGEFEEVIVGAGETFHSRAFSQPVTTWSEPTGDGRMSHRSIEIPVDEYPQFQAVRLEQCWLTTKLHALRAPNPADKQ